MKVLRQQLGSTDLNVSVLGFGTVKFGRNSDVKYPESFTLPDDVAAADLLALAQDLNINLIDTAPAYGTSEERLGKLLRGQRDSWVIVGKAGEDYVDHKSSYNFKRQHILESIKRSLQRMRVEYIDLLLIHSDGNDEYNINAFDVFNTLDDAKQQGLIRYSGMSTKTVTGGLLTLQHADVAMVTHNPSYTDELPVIEYAAQHKKGILIKKAFGSGHLAPRACMDFVLQTPGISSIILGTINPIHLVENATLAVEAMAAQAS